MQQGEVVTLNLDRGYGFIRPDGHKVDVFVHATSLVGGLTWDETLLHQRVAFNIVQEARGLRADAVQPAREE